VNYTNQQRKALHLWCRQCERVLNKAGLFRNGVLDYRKQYKWGEGDFKYYVYKPFLDSYAGKKSTEDQSSIDPSDVYLALSGHFQSEHGVQLPEWPSIR
jgi:hypothetical protein